MPGTGFGATDLDPLERYGAMRAQQALFDVQPLASGPSTGYDEFVDAQGEVRPAWQELADCVRERGRDGLARLRAAVRGLVDNDGITYVQVDRHGEAITDTDGTEIDTTEFFGPSGEQAAAAAGDDDEDDDDDDSEDAGDEAEAQNDEVKADDTK